MSKPDPYPTWAKYAAILVFLIASFFSFSLAWPFQPYRYLEFLELPEQGCVNEGIVLEAEREIVKPAFGSLDRAMVRSYWYDENTQQLEAAGEVPIPIEETEFERITSPVLREAPSKPGEYSLYVETTVYGYVGIVQRHSTIGTWSPNTIEIVECGEAT